MDGACPPQRERAWPASLRVSLHSCPWWDSCSPGLRLRHRRRRHNSKATAAGPARCVLLRLQWRQHPRHQRLVTTPCSLRTVNGRCLMWLPDRVEGPRQEAKMQLCVMRGHGLVQNLAVRFIMWEFPHGTTRASRQSATRTRSPAVSDRVLRCRWQHMLTTYHESLCVPVQAHREPYERCRESHSHMPVRRESSGQRCMHRQDGRIR